MSRFEAVAMTMHHDLRARYLAWSPVAEEALHELIPRQCSSGWLSRTCSPLEGDWDAEAVSPVSFAPAALYLKRGGKQIRALLADLMLQASGSDPAERPELLGMVEGFHLVSVLTAEIVWRCPEFRGGPSALQTFGLTHVGLTIYTLRYHLYGLLRENRFGLTEHARREVFEAVADQGFRLALCLGPAWKAWQAGSVAGAEQYRSSHPGTFRLAATVAAAAAGVPEADRASLIRYADQLEAVYRLRRELLDLQAGQAFRAGTPTFALACIADRLDQAGRRQLREWLEAAAGDAAARHQVTGLVTEYGGVEVTERELSGCAAGAQALAAAMRFAPGDRELLSSLVIYAARRPR